MTQTKDPLSMGEGLLSYPAGNPIIFIARSGMLLHSSRYGGSASSMAGKRPIGGLNWLSVLSSLHWLTSPRSAGAWLYHEGEIEVRIDTDALCGREAHLSPGGHHYLPDVHAEVGIGGLVGLHVRPGVIHPDLHIAATPFV